MSDDGEQRKNIPGLPQSEREALQDTAGNDSGNEEAQLLGQDLTEEELRQQAVRSDHRRNENFRDHFEKIATASLWGIALILTLVVVAWFWHLLAPGEWGWLSVDQLSKLQNIVTGGSLTSIASIAARHIIKRLRYSNL